MKSHNKRHALLPKNQNHTTNFCSNLPKIKNQIERALAIFQSQKRTTASVSNFFFQFNRRVWKFGKNTDSSKTQIRHKSSANPVPTEAKEDGTESECEDEKYSSRSVKSGTLENVFDREMKSICSEFPRELRVCVHRVHSIHMLWSIRQLFTF